MNLQQALTNRDTPNNRWANKKASPHLSFQIVEINQIRRKRRKLSLMCFLRTRLPICKSMMTASLFVAMSSRSPLLRNLSMQKTMKSWFTTVIAVHAVLATLSYSAKQSRPAPNSSQRSTNRPFERREAIFTRSSCQQMVSISRFTQWVKTMHMLRPADAPLSMGRCSETRQLAKRFVTQSISTLKRRKWRGASAANSSKTFAVLTC